MPRVAVPLALATSPRLHRLLPAQLAVLAGEAHARVAWRASASVRERANATMQAIVAGTERAREAEALARLQVIESYAQRMLFWQAPSQPELDEQSLSILRSALSDGRGVIISCCHLGPFYDVAACARAVGRHSFDVAGEWFFERPPANYAGRRLAHWWAKIASRGNYLIHSSNSFATLRTLLEEGEVTLIYFDSVGSRETSFLGKPVALASGTTRLELATGALVLPVRARRDGVRVWIDVTTPIDPRGFTDLDQLQGAIADVHSTLILERPEAFENPRRPGAWEHGATAEGWVAPR